MAELADALVSGSSEAIHVGSSPVVRTKNKCRMGYILHLFFIQVADLVYHQPFRAGYHLAFGEYIITEGAFLCDLMICTPPA